VPKKRVANCIEVMSHIDDVIRHHEETMHKDISSQMSEVKGALSSLTHDVNTSFDALLERMDKIQEETAALIRAKEAVMWNKDLIIILGKIFLALSVIGGSMLGAAAIFKRWMGG